ncbi:MAG: transcriptional repressor [Eubacteriales bacterium]|nr:transcriptional repressor [Eubacteriales bacterium]
MKYSKQKNLIYEIVKNTDTHPTADWVYMKAREQMPNIGVATVYRNLNALVEEGSLACVKSYGKADRYDGRLEKHMHMQCVKCGRVFDLFPNSPEAEENVVEQVCRVYNINRNAYIPDLTTLSGICDECVEKENEAPSLIK